MAQAELIPTFSPLVSEEARRLRMTLREAMMSGGFAPFDGEWWHFSYGDREWAKYYGAATARYDVAVVST
jgi:D-alanyl-D-alanine dipeptidase